MPLKGIFFYLNFLEFSKNRKQYKKRDIHFFIPPDFRTLRLGWFYLFI